MNKKCRDFWISFLKQAGLPLEELPLEVFHFTDSKEYADELARAAISGLKTGTAGLLWEIEEYSPGIAKPGDLSIVTYANEEPACVIETEEVNIVPFNEVTAEFTATEGADDPSLEHWRRCHWKEFVVQCDKLNRTPTENMPVICEKFKVVYT